MDHELLIGRLTAARVARLATVGTDGSPHVVPIVFAFDDGGRIYSAVDAKPKRSQNLRRLRNIRANEHVSLLVDHYDDDWSRLWWIRADGAATVVTSGPRWIAAIDALSAKYPQYRTARPDGPVIEIVVEGLSGWSA